jgi:hypothetical protein
MNKINTLSDNFNFDSISLGVPMALKGGTFFSKLLIYNNDFFMQLSKCSMKQGIVTTGKKTYCDLMFSNLDIHVINWFENLETTVQQLIYEKRQIWFENELDMDDIETAFTSPLRVFKSGKNYLVRCYLGKNINNSTICYSENEEPLDTDCLMNQSTKMVPLIEILGVKFSSKNFTIDINLRQVMVINEIEFSNCMINYNNSDTQSVSKISLEKNIVLESENEDEHEDVGDVTDKEKEKEKENDQPSQELQQDQHDVIELNKPHEEKESHEERDLDEEKESHLEISEDKNKNKKEEQNLEENKESVLSVNTEIENLEKKNSLGEIEEVEIELGTELGEDDSISLKDRNSVYLEMWKKAKEKAKNCRQEAIKAYLEAKNIKETYMLNEIDSDSDHDYEELGKMEF